MRHVVGQSTRQELWDTVVQVRGALFTARWCRLKCLRCTCTRLPLTHALYPPTHSALHT